MFTCGKCNKEFKVWAGKCPGCNAYQSLAEGSKGRRSMLDAGKPTKMSEVVDEDIHRIMTGTREFDRVLGKGMAQGSAILISGDPGAGKALHDEEPVLTVSGWVAIKNLKVGDRIIGSNGKPIRVLGVYPQGVRPTFKVKTSDGGEVVCSGDHLWQTRTRKDRVRGTKPSTRTTEEIRQTLVRSDGRLNHSIPFVAPVHFNGESRHLEIDPYVLGLYLADGCHGKSNNNVIFTNPEQDIRQKVEKSLPWTDMLKVFRRDGLSWRVKRKVQNGARSRTSLALIKLGLYDKDSFSKFVPKKYLYSSVENRVKLLQGLLDGDGFVPPSGTNVEYTTTSNRLAADVIQLARSLGARVTSHTRKTRFTTAQGGKKWGAKSWRIRISFTNDIQPVSSKKHLARYRKVTRLGERFIKDVVSVGNGPCTCIKVSAPDGLFVTHDHILTHNSTLSLQVGCELADAPVDPCKVLYISGEETPSQVRQRGERIAPKMSSIVLCCETSVKKIIEHLINLDPDVAIIDSIQTMRAPGMEDEEAGSVLQVTRSAAALISVCKRRDITLYIIGHITKDGTIAGPKTLEHLVDTVLLFGGEQSSDLRILSALKNRFGATSEVGIFRMTKDGLVSADDPKEHLLRGKKAGAGSALTAAIMKAGMGAGTRATILEVECLVSASRSKTPKRVIQGYDAGRLEMMLAILNKHTDFGGVGEGDIYINLGGGMRGVEENALDIPVMLALVSDFVRKPLAPGCIAWGEVGLSGIIRPEASTDRRVAMCEAMKIKVERRIFSEPGKVISIQEALTLSGLMAAMQEEMAPPKADLLPPKASLPLKPPKAAAATPTGGGPGSGGGQPPVSSSPTVPLALPVSDTDGSVTSVGVGVEAATLLGENALGGRDGDSAEIRSTEETLAVENRKAASGEGEEVESTAGASDA